MKFFLSPRCTGLLEESGPLFPLPRRAHSRRRRVGAHVYDRRLRVLVYPNRSLSVLFLLLRSSFSYPAERGGGGIRALIRANYTGGSQFNFT